MDEGDRRVKRTQKYLMEALIAVSLEKGYDAVKIRDITDRAKIAYSTFFRHYRDKDNLLLKMLESVYGSLVDLNAAKRAATGSAQGRILFEHVLEYHRFYHAMFNSQKANEILKPLQDSIAENIRLHYPVLSNGPLPLELISNHVMISGLGMIKWWLDNDMPYSVERMGVAFDELIVKTLERLFLA